MRRIHLFFLLLSSAMFLSAQDFGQIIEINHYTKGLQETDGGNSIALFEDRVHLLWQDMDSTWSSYVSTSYDGGATFNQETRVDTSIAQVFGTITVDDTGDLYVVYDDVDFDQGMINGVYLSKSTDGGQTFLKPVTVSLDGAFPEVQVSGNHVYVSYMSMDSDTTFGFFFSRSIDGGSTFETPYKITSEPTEFIKMDSPSVLKLGPDGTLYFAWNDGRRAGDGSDIYIAKSTDNGQSFGAHSLVNVPTDGIRKLRTAPGIAFGDGNVYLIWREDADDSGGGRRILFAKASQMDLAFGSTQQIVTGGWASPCIATTPNGDIYLGYPQQGDHTNGLFVTSSSDQGQTFPKTVLVSQPGEFVKDPSIMIGQDYIIHALWTIGRDDNEDDVYYVQGQIQTTAVDGFENALPISFALHPASPNPFNPMTTIQYGIPEASNVKLMIYNISGHVIRTLVQSELDAGYYSVQWDGINDYGQPVSSGTYIARIQAGSFTDVMKMVYLK